MLHHCGFKVKLGAGFVIRIVVLTIECEAASYCDFVSILGVKPCAGSSGVEGPAVEAHIDDVLLVIVANWNIK